MDFADLMALGTLARNTASTSLYKGHGFTLHTRSTASRAPPSGGSESPACVQLPKGRKAGKAILDLLLPHSEPSG
jgi:hypothetical protein